MIRPPPVANIYVMTSGLVMNPNSWNSLPPDAPKIMTDLPGLKMAEQGGDAFDRYAAGAEAEAKQKGADVYQLPPAERKAWREKGQPVSEAWIADMEKKNIPGKKIYQEAVSLMEKDSK